MAPILQQQQQAREEKEEVDVILVGQALPPGDSSCGTTTIIPMIEEKWRMDQCMPWMNKN
jgi:hypothetical protein